MDVKETLNEGLKREFAVNLPGEEFNSIYQPRLKELAKNLDIDGFRKGHVPPMIAQQRYGKRLEAEILQELVQDSVKKIFEERDIHAVTQPKVNLESVENPQKEIKFTVSSEIMPKIALPDLSKITLERETAPVDDAAIDKTIKFMAEREPNFVTIKTDRASKKGDVLCIDFLGKDDGKPFPGGKGDDINVELGKGQFIPGFEEQIEGMKPGDEKTINVTFPKDYNAQQLAGKAVTFDVKAKAIKKIETPKIDDAFAQKLKYKDLSALKEFLKKELQTQYEHVSKEKLRVSLMDKLADLKDFELPQELVDSEFKSVWGEVQNAKKAGKLDKEDADKDEKTLREDYMKIVRRRIKLGLILAEAGRKEHVHVEQPDIEVAIRAEAAKYPGMGEKVVEYFSKSSQARNALIGEIYQEKIVDYILSHAHVENKEVSPEEFLPEGA